MSDTVTKNREKYIGGSDIPAIMGLSEFKTRYQLLREKAGLTKNEFKGNVYTEYGTAMESAIRDYVNDFYKFEGDKAFKPSVHYVEDLPIINVRCNTDGENDTAILEVKTTSRDDKGLYSMSVHDFLIANYMDYLVQTLFYMEVTDKNLGVIAVYQRPEDLDRKFDKDRLHLYWFTKKEFSDITKDILAEVERFRIDLQSLKANPALTEMDFLPREVQNVCDSVMILEDKLKEYKTTVDEYEEQKEKLRLAMVKAGVTSFRTRNGTLITAVEAVQSRVVETEDFDTDKFKEDHPRLFKKFLVKKSVTKSGKKAYLKITYPKEEQK